MSRTIKQYSHAVKQHVVIEIEAGRLSPAEARRRSASRALKPYTAGCVLSGKQTRTAARSYVTMKDEQDSLARREAEILRLKAEKQALESALAQKELNLLMLESFITVTERHFGCEEGFIKKNFAPKPPARPNTP